MAKDVKKRSFTVKKTGYILGSESVDLALEEMDIAKASLKSNGFIMPNMKIFLKEMGEVEVKNAKKVQLSVTVNIEEV